MMEDGRVTGLGQAVGSGGHVGVDVTEPPERVVGLKPGQGDHFHFFGPSHSSRTENVRRAARATDGHQQVPWVCPALERDREDLGIAQVVSDSRQQAEVRKNLRVQVAIFSKVGRKVTGHRSAGAVADEINRSMLFSYGNCQFLPAFKGLIRSEGFSLLVRKLNLAQDSRQLFRVTVP